MLPAASPFKGHRCHPRKCFSLVAPPQIALRDLHDPPLIVQILAPLHRFGDASPPTPPPRAAGPPEGHHRSSEFPRRLGTPSSCHSSAPHVDSMHRWTPVSFMLPIVLTPADGVHLVAQSAAASGADAGVEAW
jgi:hypothetical protein